MHADGCKDELSFLLGLHGRPHVMPPTAGAFIVELSRMILCTCLRRQELPVSLARLEKSGPGGRPTSPLAGQDTPLKRGTAALSQTLAGLPFRLCGRIKDNTEYRVRDLLFVPV